MTVPNKGPNRNSPTPTAPWKREVSRLKQVRCTWEGEDNARVGLSVGSVVLIHCNKVMRLSHDGWSTIRTVMGAWVGIVVRDSELKEKYVIR